MTSQILSQPAVAVQSPAASARYRIGQRVEIRVSVKRFGGASGTITAVRHTMHGIVCSVALDMDSDTAPSRDYYAYQLFVVIS